jgi:dephospho-CoA kinase
MKVLGITGQIGSGKTHITEFFRDFGCPVFYSDIEARRLYKDAEVIEDIKKEIGSDVFTDGKLDKEKIRMYISKSALNANAISYIFHPRVKAKFIEFKRDWEKFIGKTDIMIYESALLKGDESYIDYYLYVYSNTALREERVIHRDKISANIFAAISAKQKNPSDILEFSDFVIVNNSLTDELLEMQVKTIIDILKEI